MFQSLSGLSLGLNVSPTLADNRRQKVSIPFRAVTGFERQNRLDRRSDENLFQSLSGLSLGLNPVISTYTHPTIQVSIPFRAVTGFELADLPTSTEVGRGFNPFQGCHWV